MGRDTGYHPSATDDATGIWDWRQLRWLSYLGWWQDNNKSEFSRKMLRVYGILLFLFDFVQIGPEFIALFLASSSGSLGEVVHNLNNTLMGVLCGAKISVHLLNGGTLRGTISELKDLDEKARKMVGGSVYEGITGSRKGNCKRTAAIRHLYFCTLYAWLARALILNYFFSTKTLLVISWIPWDYNTELGWVLMFFVQTIHLCTAVLGYIFIDTLYFSIFESILGHLDVLIYCLSMMDFRSPGVDHHSSPPLRFCVGYHQRILKLCDTMNRLAGVVVSVLVMVMTIQMCMLVFEITTMTVIDIAKILNLAALLMSSLIASFLFCYYFQNISEKLSKHLMQAAYNNNWYEGREEDKSALTIMVEMASREIAFGYIIPLDFGTFLAILKSAFSYYNFLQAIAEE